MQSRTATPADAAAITTTIALAFRDDPVWGPALEAADGGTGHLEPFWRCFVEGAIPHGAVRLVDGPNGEAATVAIWLPPDVPELTEKQEAEADDLMRRTLTPDRFEAYRRLWERFEESHPHNRPNMYLSLLATHPNHRGRGIGQELLAESLRAFDEHDIPAYLESRTPRTTTATSGRGSARSAGSGR